MDFLNLLLACLNFPCFPLVSLEGPYTAVRAFLSHLKSLISLPDIPSQFGSEKKKRKEKNRLQGEVF